MGRGEGGRAKTTFKDFLAVTQFAIVTLLVLLSMKLVSMAEFTDILSASWFTFA